MATPIFQRETWKERHFYKTHHSGYWVAKVLLFFIAIVLTQILFFHHPQNQLFDGYKNDKKISIISFIIHKNQAITNTYIITARAGWMWYALKWIFWR